SASSWCRPRCGPMAARSDGEAGERELAGRTCAITGGGRGIGASIAHAFAREGGRLAILDRDLDLAKASQAALEAAGADARAYQVDVTDEAGVTAVAEQVLTDFGRVDVLVNNAGISKLGPSMTFPLKDWQESFDVLTTGVFLCSREFGR